MDAPESVKMYWILSIQLLFGILIVQKAITQLTQKNLLTVSSATNFRVCTFICFFAATFLTRAHPIVQFVLITATCGMFLSSEFVFKMRLKSRIHSEFPDFINRTILAMKTGMSFRAATERSVAPISQLWEKWLFTMLESRVFLHQNGASHDAEVPIWWRPQLDELTKIHQSPHHALARLENLRKKMKVASDFRRKSGQALLQARIQIVVMTLLYIAVLVLTMNQYHEHRHLRLILISGSLFVSGQLLFWWIARKRKWNI